MLIRKNESFPLRYLVSLGAGTHQIPLIRTALDMGLRIIAVDRNASAPGFMHSDLRIQESTSNDKEIYRKLRELLFDGVIEAVMSKSYGEAVCTASKLNRVFGVEHIDPDICADFLSKKAMKKRLEEAGIPVPPRRTVSRGSLKRIDPGDYPLVVKPDKGHAKKGVFLVRKEGELKKALKDDPRLVIEKQIRGDEIIAAGLVHRGNFHLISISDKVRSPEPWFLDLEHSTPSRHAEKAPEIGKMGDSIARAFRLVNTPLVMELILSEEGIFCIEAVPEFGGEYLPEYLVPESTGIDFIKLAISSLTGRKITLPPYREQSALVIRYLTGTGGTLQSIDSRAPAGMEDVIYSRALKRPGARVEQPQTNLDRVGVVITRGKNLEEARQRAVEAGESFNIRII